MTFRVGMKVVCINASGLDVPTHYFSAPLVKNAVYTIRGIQPESIGSPPVIALCLEEIIGEIHNHWKVECAFRASRFRPLTETKSSISFTQGAPKDSEKFDNRRKVRERA